MPSLSCSFDTSSFTPRRGPFPFLAALAALLGLCAVRVAPAATLTWTGAGANGYWTNRTNWGGSVPADGDTLVFPHGTPRRVSTNTISDLVLHRIRFTGSGLGHTLRGTSVWVTNGVWAEQGTGESSLDLTARLRTIHQTFGNVGGGVLHFSGGIAFYGYSLTLTNSSGGNMDVTGLISGNGNLTKTGPGQLRFAGSVPNTYSGTMRLVSGSMLLENASSNAITGDFEIGSSNTTASVQWLGHHQVASEAHVRVQNFSVMDLNGYSNTVASLAFAKGGTVRTGLGVLRLGGNVTVTDPVGDAFIYGLLHLGDSTRTFTVDEAADGPALTIYASIRGGSRVLPGGGIVLAGLIKEGAGEMGLAGNNSYGGYTTVNGGILLVTSDTGLGGTLSGTGVNQDARLWLDGASLGTEELTLNCTNDFGGLRATGNCSVAGDIILGTHATILGYGGTLTLNGQIRGTGDVTLGDPAYPGATFIFGGSTSNVYTGVTWLRSGTLLLAKSVMWGTVPGALIIGDGLGIADADVVRFQGNGQTHVACDVTLTSSGFFDLNGYGTYVDGLTGTGHLSLQEGVLSVGADNGSSVFDGTITGANGLVRKIGSGTLTLTGTNTYTGTNLVDGGRLIVNGYQPGSAVTVDDNASHPGLGGTGTVGNLFMEGGPLTPGTSPGILTCSNLLLYGPVTCSAELNGTIAGTGYDQLRVRGTVALANPALQVTPGFMPTEGNRFVILNNETANPVTGSFAGLPEGALVSSGPLQFRISYVGGTGGNDVVLTFTNASVQPPGAFVAGGGNGNGILDPNECNDLRVVVTNGSSTPMSGVVATLTPVTAGVAVTYATSAYPDIAADGRGTNLEPFQVTTWPGLPCGTLVELDLEVQTATHGNFTLPVSLWSGSPGVHVPYGIAEGTFPLGGINYTSSVNVGGFSEPLAKVTVSLYLSDTRDGDLDLSLIGPDGTAVPLSRGNGGSGTSYGTSCRDRTVFDDGAARSITTGSAPFAGTYRPEGQLSSFRGQVGNGFWRLWVRSRTHLPLQGTLHCWTVNLYRFACVDGGGVCESCPDRTVYGRLGGFSASQDRRLLMNGELPQCEARLKLCPGLTSMGPRQYDAYPFLNGESNACITVALTSRAPLFSAAYLDRYNPSDLCENYRADRAASTVVAPFLPYSFEVPANARFIVVVNEVDMATYAPYTLTVSGGSCRPVLHIQPASTNSVVLDWTTAAAGYQLEQTNVLASPPHPGWGPVSGVPTVIHGRFRLTNSVVPGTSRFYQLRKP